MFVLIHSPNLEVNFEPVLVEERLPSVAFNISANWNILFLQAQITIKECWFEYSRLIEFEKNLKRLMKRQINCVKLLDINLQPILQFIRNGEELVFELDTGHSLDLGSVIIKTKFDDHELAESVERLNKWDKWW